VSSGRTWFERVTSGAKNIEGLPPSVLAADVTLDGRAVRVVAVVPDRNGRFPLARKGEVGIDEGFGLARAVNGAPKGSAILAIVDVPGQAFGTREEAVGLQRALAASANAYIRARRAGHPVYALVVGKAISGAFLAHGLQAGWIGALDDPDIEVHVMSEPAVARVTRMERADIARLAKEIPPTARDIHSFATLGAIDRILQEDDVMSALVQALQKPELGLRNPLERLYRPAASQTRAIARRVREELQAQWDA
jgi:biotin-independent malonate decarboxylase gamma subunit